MAAKHAEIDALLTENRKFPPPREFRKNALVSDANVACVALQDLDNQHGANVDLSCTH